MVAPIFLSPLMCRSMGRPPMAQPPGIATRAIPARATKGPKTSELALMVLTISYLATGSESVAQRILVHWFVSTSCKSTSAPMDARSLRSVSMSRTWGMFSRTTSSSVKMAAAMQGNAEFFAPDTWTVPTSGVPPITKNLSMKGEQLLSFQCKSVSSAASRNGSYTCGSLKVSDFDFGEGKKDDAGKFWLACGYGGGDVAVWNGNAYRIDNCCVRTRFDCCCVTFAASSDDS